MLPEGLTARVKKDSYEVPAIFRLMEERAGLSERDLYNTFNMGIGLCLAVDADKAEAIVSHLKELGEQAYIIGDVVEGSEGVILV